MLSGVPLFTKWRILTLQMEETAFRYTECLRIYIMISRGQTTKGGFPVWGSGEVLTTYSLTK